MAAQRLKASAPLSLSHANRLALRYYMSGWPVAMVRAGSLYRVLVEVQS